MKKYLVGILATICLLCAGCSDPIEDGATLLEEGKFEEAVDKFETAIEKEVNLGEAYRGLAICYWEALDYEAAHKAFGLALEHGAQPTGQMYNLLGLCAMEIGDPEKAVYYFAQGQTFEQVSEELLQEMAFNEIVAYETLGLYEEARERLGVYVGNYPDDTAAAKELEFLNTQSPKSE